MLERTTGVEVIARRSAVPPPGDGKVVISMIRKRRRVMVAPVVFCTLRLIESTPLGAVGGAGVNVRSRFGEADCDCVPSSSGTRTPALSRRIGDARFSGPGA